MYTIEMFRQINKIENIVMTQHSRIRLVERGILINDIVKAIDNGEIIEDYEDDYPFPSCLILGKSEEKAIHICASINDNNIYLITAYIPDENRWTDGFKKRVK